MAAASTPKPPKEKSEIQLEYLEGTTISDVQIVSSWYLRIS